MGGQWGYVDTKEKGKSDGVYGKREGIWGEADASGKPYGVMLIARPTRQFSHCHLYIRRTVGFSVVSVCQDIYEIIAIIFSNG